MVKKNYRTSQRVRNWLEVSQNKNHSHIHLTKSHSSPLCHAKSYCVGSVITPRNMCGYFPRSFEDEGFFFLIFSYIFSQSNFKDTTKNLTNFTKPSWSLIYVAVPILPFPVFCPSRFFLFQSPTLNSHNWGVFFPFPFPISKTNKRMPFR